VQSEKTGDENDDDDDADDVENVHDVLRLRHTRFQNEKHGAPTGTSRPTSMFRKPREPSTVKVVNSIQIDIVDRHTIDAGRVTAAAAAPYLVSPVF
jgi:hypothetical protein